MARAGPSRGRLHRPGDDAGDQHVGLHPAGGLQVVAEGLGLAAAEVGQTGATGPAADHPVEAGEGVAVSDQDQTHPPNGTGSTAPFRRVDRHVIG